MPTWNPSTVESILEHRADAFLTQALGKYLLTLPVVVMGLGPTTIKELLIAILGRFWKDPEGFRGKRPFGDSGWQSEVFLALVQNGLLSSMNEHDRGRKLVALAIEAL